MITKTSGVRRQREKSLVWTTFQVGHRACLDDHENDELRTAYNYILASGRAANRPINEAKKALWELARHQFSPDYPSLCSPNVAAEFMQLCHEW